jgi:hypothetical protein
VFTGEFMSVAIAIILAEFNALLLTNSILLVFWLCFNLLCQLIDHVTLSVIL